jgi:RsmE family RNA methyltransferase
MNLLLLEPHELDANGIARIADIRGTHLRTVLHAAPGRPIRVGLVDGAFGAGHVVGVTESHVTLRCEFETAAPERPSVDILLAVPRPKVLRRLWAQIAALGVGRIMLTNAARVERNYFDTHLLEPHGYRPLLIEGLQQARDTRLPLVSVHRQFRVLVEDELDQLSDAALRVVADPAASSRVADVLADAKGCRLLLAIGPEGGWNTFELEMLGAHGFTAVGMGPRTLRSDTACIALLALAHDALSSPSDGSGRTL